MKAAKYWRTTVPTACSLCREPVPPHSTGVFCDIAGPIEKTTIVKFVCKACADDIAGAIAVATLPDAERARGAR